MQIQNSFKEPGGPGERQGCLYLVGTPIGNLEDITFRAVRILKEADWVAAEDTRQTVKLLRHFDISTRLVSYHEHNKRQSGRQLLDKMRQGQTVALVSDAGLPAISDPGHDLVVLAIEHDVPVIPIPGANAALTALIASGLPTEAFRFAGFLPRQPRKLEQALQRLKSGRETLLLYESPHRIEATLAAMLANWGNRRIVLARELTKKFEEFARGRLDECLERLRETGGKGEYCIIVEGESEEAALADGDAPWWNGWSVAEHVEHYMKQSNSRKDAMKLAAADRQVSKREIYGEWVGRNKPES